jgi:hypothetical protein
MNEYDVSYIDTIRVTAENVTAAERIAREQIAREWTPVQPTDFTIPRREPRVFRVAMVWEKP